MGAARPESTSSGEGRVAMSGGGAGWPDRSTQDTSPEGAGPEMDKGSNPKEAGGRRLRKKRAKSWKEKGGRVGGGGKRAI